MENPFYSASNTIIKNGSVFSKSANVIVFTIDKIVFDMPLTPEQRDGSEEKPNVIQKCRNWFVQNENDFPVSMSLYIPKENIQPLYGINYIESNYYYQFNIIIQGKETTDTIISNVCDTTLNELDKDWSDKWYWHSIPVNSTSSPDSPLFSTNTMINRIAEYTAHSEVFSPLPFSYKNIYKPNKFHGKFIYKLKLKSTILPTYQRCFIPDLCALYNNNVQFLDFSPSLDHLDSSYLFNDKKYTFMMTISQVLYQNHNHTMKLDFIPLKKMKIMFKSKYNIMALAYAYKKKTLSQIISFEQAFNSTYIGKKEFNHLICDHYNRYNIDGITEREKKNRKLVLETTKLALKQYKKLHNKLSCFLRYYTDKDVAKFAKKSKKIETIQKNLFNTTISMSKERVAFGGGTDTCGICLENLNEEDDDGTIAETYVLSKCKHVFHLNCIVSMNNTIRDSYNNPGDIWDYESLKHHFQCPYCRTKLSPIDIITSTPSKGMGVLL